MVRISLLKLTDGVVNPAMEWNFSLEGDSVSFSDTTKDDADGILFSGLNLDPYDKYTICELGVPAGWAGEWKIDRSDPLDGTPDTIIIPYNPNADDDPPQDLGNRCFDFGYGTEDLIPPGSILAFQVNNTFPGGEPRTPGYWKNWNTCTKGNQAETAAKNGGTAEGWFILDDILNSPGISWGEFIIATCEDGVSILDQRDLNTGKKKARDAGYTLAMHLLAAQLNFAAGAETCQEALDAALEGENLLIRLGFNGTGNYLRPKHKDYAYALELANTLDLYNNGILCSSIP
jgi:hypothetical protein